MKANLPLIAAYELAIQQRVKYVNDILQALLTARKRVCVYKCLVLTTLANDPRPILYVFPEMG